MPSTSIPGQEDIMDLNTQAIEGLLSSDELKEVKDYFKAKKQAS